MQLLETIRNGWKVVELRKKIFYTVFIIILFRIGSFIPAPFIDAAKLSSQLDRYLHQHRKHPFQLSYRY